MSVPSTATSRASTSPGRPAAANYEFEALHGLGRLHHTTGSPDAALAHHHQALKLATDLGQPADQARAHDGLAHAHYNLNQPENTRQHWRQALDILTSLGTDHTDDPETNTTAIRAHLATRATLSRGERADLTASLTPAEQQRHSVPTAGAA